MDDKTKSLTPNAPADFSPNSGTYIGVRPFRYWCQKVLPLVYDDSLSYMELLCKVVDLLNKVIEDINTSITDIAALHKAFDELQSYVNTYFQNLDIQKEVDNKLDRMTQQGFFDKLLDNVVKHNETNSITMNMLTQEVKEAMTGGSVPVVGVDSVDTDNLKNRSVDMYKLYDAINNGSIKNNKLVKGNYQSADNMIHFLPESENVLMAIPVTYGQRYTIYRSIMDEWFTLVEIKGDFVDQAPATLVFSLAISGWRGYYYTPTSNEVTYLVINFHRNGSTYTVRQLFDDLKVVQGIYQFSAFNYQDFISDSFQFEKPMGYNLTIKDVPEKEIFAWGEGVLGSGDTFKLPYPLDIPTLPDNPANFTASIGNMTYSELIAMYDTLFDAPNRKSIIGYATQRSAETQPDYSFPIYLYSYSSSAGNAKNSFGIKPLNILLVSGVHGDEKGAPYSMFKMLEIMLDQYNNSLLREAYTNINIDFVPAVNPLGYNIGTQDNARQVDINRNFSYHWDTDTSPDKGTAPLSEIESQSLAAQIELKKYDYIIDWHEANLSNGTYVATQNVDLAKVHMDNCRKLYTNCYNRYGMYIINATHGVAELNNLPSLANEMLAKYDINNGLIFEQAWGATAAKWTSRQISIGVEMMSNLILEYARRFGTTK